MKCVVPGENESDLRWHLHGTRRKDNIKQHFDKVPSDVLITCAANVLVLTSRFHD